MEVPPASKTELRWWRSSTLKHLRVLESRKTCEAGGIAAYIVCMVPSDDDDREDDERSIVREGTVLKERSVLGGLARLKKKRSVL